MRLQVAKRDLEAALQVVQPSLAGSGTDISTHFLFRRTEPEKGKKEYGIEVLTFSNRIFSSCPVIGTVKDPGTKAAFTVEGKRLKQWLANVGDAALTLTFDEEEGEVEARAPKGKQTFKSLNPDNFPFWDKSLLAAEVTMMMEAIRIADALSYAKQFASDKESSHPELCVCEIKGGILNATDKKAVTLIRLAGAGDSSMRLHAKDVSGVLAFLGTFNETKVEVLEHARALFFRRGDGAVFGEARFKAPFPKLGIDIDGKPMHTWVLSKSEIEEAIGFLTAGAAWEDNRLRFAPGKDDEEVILSMASVTGKITKLSLTCLKSESVDDAKEIPEEGFALDHPSLHKVLRWWKGDTVTFGITPSVAPQGYVQFVTDFDDDRFLTILAWLRK